MRQQQPEGVAAGGVDLLGKLVRRLLIGVAVRIVDARKHDGIAVPRERHKFVGEHRHAALAQRALERAHGGGAMSPLVVARDVICRCDGRERRADFRGVGVRFLCPAVDEIARHEDLLRLRGSDRRVKALIVLAEIFSVQVA